MEEAVYSFSSGFAYVVGEVFSLHVLETNMFYDVSFTSWAQGNGGGNGAGGGFSYIRTTVDGGIEPPGPLNFSNYTLSISDAESYQSGSESVLPSLNVDGDGIVIKAEFAVSDDITDPYVGALGVYMDANFNGQLDEGDYNISGDFYDSNEDDDMGEDGPRNREHDEGPGVVALFDNGPMDTDDAVGVFVGVLDDFDFMSVQGATFFFAEINPEGDVTNSFNVMPYSDGDFRFMGDVYYDDGATFDATGIFVVVQKLVTTTWNDGNSYSTDYDDVALGVTINGSYSIRASDLVVGDTLDIVVEAENDRRIYPYFSSEDQPLAEGPYDYGSFSEYLMTVTTSEFDFRADIRALVFNTLIQGYALDANGNPLIGEVLLYWEAYPSSSQDADDYLSVYNFTDVQDDGYYSLWSMNGTTVDIMFIPYGPGNGIENTVMVVAEEYSDALEANVFNYNIDTSPSQNTATIAGYVYEEDGLGDGIQVYLSGVRIIISSDSSLYETYTDESGHFMIEVAAPAFYYVVADNNYPGYNLESGQFVDVSEIGTYQEVYIGAFPIINYYEISGYVYDQNAEPINGAEVGIKLSHMNNDDSDSDHDGWYDWTYTNASGYYYIAVPAGVYDMDVIADGFLYEYAFDVEVNDDVVQDFYLNPVGEFTGGVQGVVTLIGEYDLDGEHVYIDVESNLFSATTYADENGFFSIELIDGVYDIYAYTSGYESYYMENAFEVSGNTVIYDIELFEYGFAGPPHMMNLHDVANDQGRQMRAVWDAGMPGDWGYFTQFSIWRKVNNTPIELWDYIETVPWHGMDPYAAVVPTLGDSSMHGMHMSTFMVTAHTEDVAFWLDSEPMSGYSIDNLHPEAPMSVSFSTNPGAVSLTWSGPADEDFSYFNIYRQDILTNDPAMVFTTTDSFYVDQELSDVGAYEYWVTAVDMSGLESEASGVVSAVLSSEDELGMPTEFALKQNYPNPFNPSTQIQYSLPSESRVVISIYDLTGRKVRTLVNEVQSAGHRSVMWNATNEIGRQVSAGMYIYSIQAGDFIQNRKMVLMK